MKKSASMKVFIFLIIILSLTVSLVPPGFADSKPISKDGTKWKIGFYEGGPWPDYQETFVATIMSLADLGWINKIELPELQDTGDTRMLWEWLSQNVKSDYLDFVEDAYWSSNWEESRREKNRRMCLERLRHKDLDLMFALGTWAGLDLANNTHNVPTLVMSTTDPIQAGIIKSAEDSGFDHVVAECDPTRYLRQIKMFHNIIGFKKLGVVYENTKEGRAYSNLQDLRKVAKERGFKLLECTAEDEDLTEDEVLNAYIKCCEQLAPNIDAFYYGAHRGADPKHISKSLAIFNKYGVKTWSNWGITHVKKGVLLSVGTKDFKLPGKFYANQLAKIFNGTKPRDLNQVLKDDITLSVNMETARMIDYKPPKNLLRIAGSIFEKTE